MAVPFSHEPLDLKKDQIRLLQIGQLNGDLISCNVSIFDHKSCPSYECLSYVWGDMTSQHAVRLNDQQFLVGTNLYSFLELTSEANIILEDGSAYASHYLWIDQICIDQHSTIERNHQVAKMAQIYHNAKRCIVWLGSSSNIQFARDAIQSIIDTTDMMSTIQALSNAYDASDIPVLNRNFDQDEAIASLFTSDRLQAVFALLSCPYWTRVWTLGEFWLSVDILLVYGDQAIQWATLRKFWERFWMACKSDLNDDQMGGIKYIGHKNVNEDRGHQQGDPSLGSTFSWSLSTALEEFWDLNASDKRDKVYGLMGIVKADQRVYIDYSKSSQEVFWDAVEVVHSRRSITRWYWERSYLPLGLSMGVSRDELKDFYHRNLTVIPKERDAQLDMWHRGA